MKVVVVSEFYPRRSDPVLGVWAHRQTLAATRAGAQAEVVVLHRPLPPLAALRGGPGPAMRALANGVRQPRTDELDGLAVRYVRFLSPPRPLSYETWGAWAAPALAAALRTLRRRFDFDLVHAHNAVPAGDAVRRARLDVPSVVSVHGGDVLHTARRGRRGRAAVERALGAATLALANSTGIERLAREHGAQETRVVPLGADAAAAARPLPQSPTLVTVGHLVARKRHADVIRAVAALAERHPDLRYVVIGDGPERGALEELASKLGVGDRVTLRGQLTPDAALVELREASLFAMPSTDEALGVAYLEAMGAGVPAIGARGEPGPEDIAAAGTGMTLVPPRDVPALAEAVDGLLSDREELRALGEQARETVVAHFTWDRCGAATVRRTRRRCDERAAGRQPARAVRDEPRAARARRGVRRTARAGGHRRRSLRGTPRARRRRNRLSGRAQQGGRATRRVRAGGVRPLPRRRLRRRGPRRAPGRLGRCPPRRASRSSCGPPCGRTPARRPTSRAPCRCAGSTARPTPS